MKKSLLTESEIRKFMKFAKLGSLTENFIDNNIEETVAEEGVVEEIVAEEGVVEETLEEEAVESPADFVQDLVDVIMQHLPGTDISVEKGEGEGEEDGMPAMDDEEVPMDDPDAEASLEMPADDGMPPEEEEEPDMGGLVNEVTRRVAARLLKENKR